MLRGTKREIPFARVAVGGPRPIPPPESNPWYWNPGRAGIVGAPYWFAEKLEAFDPNLRATWDNYHDRWLIWMKKDKLQSKWCKGWLLLFIVQYQSGAYMPLDERVFARLYEASADKWGNGQAYFRKIQREIESAQERRERKAVEESVERALEVFDYSQIKNIGRGNKFSTYLA